MQLVLYSFRKTYFSFSMVLCCGTGPGAIDLLL